MTWKQRLDRARKVGRFTDVDKVFVSAWSTCAVGERYNVKTDANMIDIPTSVYLQGLDFLQAVMTDDVDKAHVHYDAIMASEQVNRDWVTTSVARLPFDMQKKLTEK